MMLKDTPRDSLFRFLLFLHLGRRLLLLLCLAILLRRGLLLGQWLLVLTFRFLLGLGLRRRSIALFGLGGSCLFLR